MSLIWKIALTKMQIVFWSFCKRRRINLEEDCDKWFHVRGDIFLKSKATLVFKKPSTASFAPFCNENYATTAIPQDFFEHFVEEYVLFIQPFFSRGTRQLADNTMRNKMLLHLKCESY